MEHPNEHLQNSLYLMVRQNNLKGFLGLLTAGADPRHPDGEGNTILHQAILHDHADLLQTLLKDYVDLLCMENQAGFTPLNLVISKQDLNLLDKILIKGSDSFALQGQTVIPFDLANEAIPNPETAGQFSFIEQTESAIWPLAQVVKLDWSEGIDRLINAGASLDRVDEQGRTVLHLAVIEEKANAVAALLRHDVNREAVDDEGKTALQYSKTREDLVIKELLLNELDPIDRRFLQMKEDFESKLLVQQSIIEAQQRQLDRQAKLLEVYQERQDEQKNQLDDHDTLKYYLNEHVKFFPLSSDLNKAYYIKKTLEGHSSSVDHLVLSADGAIAVSAGRYKDCLKVWDVQSGECLHTLSGHSGSINSVAITPDGAIAVSGSSDDTVKVWDIHSGECRRTLTRLYVVNDLALTADGTTIAISRFSRGKTLKVWDVQSGEDLCTLSDGRSDSYNCVALTSNGAIAVSGSRNGTLKVWDVQSGECIRILSGHSGSVDHLALSADGTIAMSKSSKTLTVWDIQSGECLHTISVCDPNYGDHITSVAITADGSIAISGQHNNTLKVWDVQSGECLRTLSGHSSSVNCVALSANWSIAVSGSGDKTLKVWELPPIRNLTVQVSKEGLEELKEMGHCTIN